MDLDRYYELRTILEQWRVRLAESIRGRIEGAARWLDRLRTIYECEGVREEFTLWLDRWYRQAAIQFILRVLFLRVLEDRGLLGVTRIRNRDGQRMWGQLTRNPGAARYVQWCCWDTAHLLPDLFGPTERELLKVIRGNAVPNRPEHYLKPVGLRKFYAARQSDPPGTPEYRSKEFSDRTAWKLRGKLNIPRERSIHYAELDHTGRGVDAPDSGGPWFGWAGWDAAQRADALALLLDRANRAGWELRWLQCGLRAALRNLLPELTELPAAERAEFEAIAGVCGIGLGSACYCQAYRDGVVRGEPGVPGVGAEVLGVKVLPSEGEGKQSRRRRKKDRGNVEQLEMDL